MLLRCLAVGLALWWSIALAACGNSGDEDCPVGCPPGWVCFLGECVPGVDGGEAGDEFEDARLEDARDDDAVEVREDARDDAADARDDATVEVREDAREAETPVDADAADDATDDAAPDETADEAPTDTDARDDAADARDDAVETTDDADTAEDSPPDIPAVCGDGTVAGPEECDDGNTTPLDGCSATCTAEYCGDGLVGTVLSRGDNFETGALTTLPWVPGSPYGFAPSTAHAHGGTYALGPQNVGLTSTTASIRLNAFTNGHVCFWYAGESESCCDHFYFSVDGTNVLSTSGAHTTWTEYCTDVTAGTHDFAWTYTKDNSINTGWDAFYFDDLRISASSTETCDDGNTTGGDGCSALCTIEECGNAILDVGEECDDGNTTALDGCNATCDREFCGDGLVGSVFGLIEGFDSGTPSGSTWTFGTPYGFEASPAHARTGSRALGPQNIGVASTTASVTLRDYLDGRLCFWWAGSSESCCDHFYFAIDGTNLLQREGTLTTWTEFCTDVAAGTHDMVWSYTKDSSINSGWDAFYVDDLDVPAFRTEQCDDGNTTAGDGCSSTCQTE